MGERNKKGITFSDLHYFAPFSNASRNLNSIEKQLEQADYCILNGDIFECWNITPSTKIEDVVKDCSQWLEGLLNRFPSCQFHYVLGNHERVKEFADNLERLTQKHKGRLQLHRSHLCLGDAIFLHGDRPIDPPKEQMPEPEIIAEKMHPANWKLYAKSVINTFAPRTIARLLYPQQKSLQQIHTWLKEKLPETCENVKHVFFGHIHYDFTAVPFGNRSYYNTGAAVKCMNVFNPLTFEITPDQRLTNIVQIGKPPTLPGRS